jgi:hypothetical protein
MKEVLSNYGSKEENCSDIPEDCYVGGHKIFSIALFTFSGILSHN